MFLLIIILSSWHNIKLKDPFFNYYSVLSFPSCLFVNHFISDLCPMFTCVLKVFFFPLQVFLLYIDGIVPQILLCFVFSYSSLFSRSFHVTIGVYFIAFNCRLGFVVDTVSAPLTSSVLTMSGHICELPDACVCISLPKSYPGLQTLLLPTVCPEGKGHYAS